MISLKQKPVLSSSQYFQHEILACLLHLYKDCLEAEATTTNRQNTRQRQLSCIIYSVRFGIPLHVACSICNDQCKNCKFASSNLRCNQLKLASRSDEQTALSSQQLYILQILHFHRIRAKPFSATGLSTKLALMASV